MYVLWKQACLSLWNLMKDDGVGIYSIGVMQFIRYVEIHKKDVWEIMQVTVLQMGGRIL